MTKEELYTELAGCTEYDWHFLGKYIRCTNPDYPPTRMCPLMALLYKRGQLRAFNYLAKGDLDNLNLSDSDKYDIIEAADQNRDTEERRRLVDLLKPRV